MEYECEYDDHDDYLLRIILKSWFSNADLGLGEYQWNMMKMMKMVSF